MLPLIFFTRNGESAAGGYFAVRGTQGHEASATYRSLQKFGRHFHRRRGGQYQPTGIPEAALSPNLGYGCLAGSDPSESLEPLPECREGRTCLGIVCSGGSCICLS